MKHKVAIAFLFFSTFAMAQGVRYDNKVSTIAANYPPGAQVPVMAIPNATVTICTDGNCLLAPAHIYSNQGLSVQTANPMKSDGKGNFGFWAAAGTYYYKAVDSAGNVLGIFPITLGGTGGGGASVCGPLSGDSTSTNCGNGNFTSTPVIEGQTIVQGYGYTNVVSSPFISEGVALGNNNLSHNVGTDSSHSLAAAVGLGLGNVNYINTGGSVVGIGQGNAQGISPGGSNSVFEIFAGGDSSAFLIGNNVDDVIALGDASANTIPSNSHDIIAIGDSADGQCPTFAPCGGIPAPVAVNNVIAIGTSTLNFNAASDVAAVGHEAMQGDSNFQNSGAFNFAFGSFALRANSTGQNNTAVGGFAGADGFVDTPRAYGNSNHTGSNNSWFGYDSGPNTTTQLSNTAAFGYQAHNTQSNQIVLGNSSMTQAVLFGTGDGCLSSSSGVVTGSGSACGSGGGGGISGLTAGFIPLAGSATTITANSHLDDGVTTAATITSSRPLAVADGTGKAGNIGLVAGTAPAAAPTSTVQINAPTSVTAYSVTLPSAQGSGSLTNNGSGVLSWTPAGGSGTVTSIATTSPITGGTITTSGTIACATCVVATTPGAGIAHFAGSTQTVTSSAVSLTADVSGNLPNANLATQTANTVLGALTATTPSGLAVPSCSTTSSALQWTSGTGFSCNTTETQTIASGTSALGTSAIASGACATVVTTAATGTASTDAITWNPNASIKAVTGYVPSTSGGLTIAAYPTTNNVNFDVCNWTSASITPGAVTLNWRVVR